MIWSILMAMAGTLSFSVLFCVPRRYYLYCAAIGGAGWAVYLAAQAFFGATLSCLFATMAIVLLSRLAAIWQRCPVTIFLIAGIMPLVPGAGVYWMAYYLVTDQLELASASGYSAIKTAVAIVLGIVLVFEIPQKLFLKLVRREP